MFEKKEEIYIIVSEEEETLNLFISRVDNKLFIRVFCRSFSVDKSLKIIFPGSAVTFIHFLVQIVKSLIPCICIIPTGLSCVLIDRTEKN
jgi:hypothetical protein